MSDPADGLERDIATLERALEGLRKEIESEVYGWGDERNRAQQRLDVGTEHLAKMRALLAEATVTEQEAKVAELDATIGKLDELKKEQLPMEEFGPDTGAR